MKTGEFLRAKKEGPKIEKIELTDCKPKGKANIDTKYKLTVLVDAALYCDIMKIAAFERAYWTKNDDKVKAKIKYPKRPQMDAASKRKDKTKLTKQYLIERGMKVVIDEYKKKNGGRLPDLPGTVEQELEMLVYTAVGRHATRHRKKYTKNNRPR